MATDLSVVSCPSPNMERHNKGWVVPWSRGLGVILKWGALKGQRPLCSEWSIEPSEIISRRLTPPTSWLASLSSRAKCQVLSWGVTQVGGKRYIKKGSIIYSFVISSFFGPKEDILDIESVRHDRLKVMVIIWKHAVHFLRRFLLSRKKSIFYTPKDLTWRTWCVDFFIRTPSHRIKTWILFIIAPSGRFQTSFFMLAACIESTFRVRKLRGTNA